MKTLDTFSEIVSLIEGKMGRYERKKLLRETCLEADLGMTGDDAFEFLEDFSKKFNVDLSDFKIQEYFAPERDGLLLGLMSFFIGKRNLPPKKELTIGDLERAVSAGKLDDVIIRTDKKISP